MKILNTNEVNYLLNIINIIPDDYNKNDDIEYELEIRFRTITDNSKSKSGVSLNKFNDLLSKEELFDNNSFNNKTIEKTLIMKDSQISNDRLIYYINTKEKIYMSKHIIKERIMDRLGIKISLAKEIKLPISEDKKYNFGRYRIRTSILSYDLLWRFDFTHIYEGNLQDKKITEWFKNIKNTDKPHKYEIELEYIGDYSIESNKIINSLDSLLYKMGFKERIEKVKNICFKYDIYDNIKNIMKNEKFKIIYDKDKINFNKIIENVKTLQQYNLDYIKKNPYYITEKIDGERYLLYIYTSNHISNENENENENDDENDDENEEVKNNLLNIKLLDSRDNCYIILNEYKLDISDEINNILPLLIDGELFETFVNKKISLMDIINNINNMITDKTNKSWIIDDKFENIKNYYGFDILIFNGNDLTQVSFSERLRKLEIASHILKKLFENLFINNTTFVGVKKSIKFIYNIKPYKPFELKNVNEIITKKNKYYTDGIIFTPINKTYYNNNTYKWKPVELNSIDFLSRIVNDDKSQKIITLHFYVGINKYLFNKFKLNHDDEYYKLFNQKYKDSNYFPVEFKPRDNPNIYITKLKYKSKKNDIYKLEIGNIEITDDIILEVIYNSKKEKSKNDDSYNRWIILRIRDDKTEKYKRGELYGNNWTTAINNWNTIKNPITLDNLINEKYYKYKYGEGRKKTNIDNMKSFHNYIKYKLYLKYTKDIKFLIELGGGRANDFNKWVKANIQHIIIIDADKDALKQADKRLIEYRKKTKKNRPKLTLILGNLQTTRICKLLLKPFFNSKLNGLFDVISCQFAFHYFIKNNASLTRILNEIYNLLKIDGYFIISDHDGLLLYNLFKKHNVEYNESLYITSNKITKNEVSSNDNLLFRLTKLYKNNMFKKTGQEISVYVESIGIEHKEYLVNFDEIINNLTNNNKFSIIENKLFEEKYNNFINQNPQSNIRNLSNGEKIFSFTNRYIVFQKNFVKDTKIKKSKKKIY